jgi:AcrR family transcriptional regulator
MNAVQKMSKMKTADRKQDLKTALIGAAERAVIAHGLAGMKARNLATEAGCAVGAIYNVVTDLDDLALAVHARTLAAIEKNLTAAATEVPVEAQAGQRRAVGQLIRMAVAYLEFAAANKPRWRALFEARVPEGKPMPEWYRAEQTRLFTYIEQPLRELRPSLPPEQRTMLARTLFSATHGIVMLGLDEKLGVVSLEELRNQTTLIVSAIVLGLSASEKAVP